MRLIDKMFMGRHRGRKAWTCAMVVALALSIGCGNEKSSDNVVTWATLIPGRTTIDQAREQVGFELILPSPLPPQMEIYRFDRFEIIDPPWQPGGSRSDAHVSIDPYPWHEELLEVQITSIHIIEYKVWPGESHSHLPVEEELTIAETDVTCHVSPNDALWVTPAAQATIPGVDLPPRVAINPSYECSWHAGDLHVQVHFSWLLREPLPRLINEEMREDALRVVRSMIEDPYIP